MVSVRIKNFYHFMGPSTVTYGALVVLIGFVSFFFDLALAFFTQRFFMSTGLVAAGSSAPLGITLQPPYWEGGALVLIGILRALTLWLNGYLTGRCQVQVETEKRQSLTEWAISTGGQEIGQVMSYFNDIIIGAAASIGNIFYVLSRLVLLGGIFIALMAASPVITLFVVGLIVVLAPLQIIIDKIISRNSGLIQSSLAKSVSLLARAIKNNLFISLHNMTSHEIAHIKASVDDYARSSIRYYSLTNLRTSIPQVMGLAAVVLIAIQGRTYFAENPAALIAYLYMVLRLFQVLSDMARVTGNLRLNYPRISILYKWWFENIRSRKHDGSREISSGQGAELIGWKARNLDYIWPNGKKTSIDNMNFDIRPGSTTLIVGPSGAGKTTLFHLLLGLLPPTHGSLTSIGASGEEGKIESRIPQTISYVGPDPFLVAGNVREQLLIGNRHLQDEELVKALKLVHADFVFDFADGLNHALTEQGQGLSAGQKQRLALARAILRKPSVLLLDEATANLDETTERVVIELVNSLRGQTTILVISHRPHADLQVDTFIDLGEGKAP